MAPPIVHEVLGSPGQPLDSATRTDFQQRLGHDFSRVRVHTGERATASAAAVNAVAYTVGNHIVFGSGYASSRHGESGRLLAHELVHVTQWGDHPIPTHLSIGSADGPSELQAQAGEVGSRGHTKSLQRAVRVCDQYRAEDTGSGTPGPGISVNVSRSGKRAEVNARLQVYGTEADAAKAGTIQNTISSNWNGSFPDGYQVITNVGVTHRAQDHGEESDATQVELVHAGAGRPSHVDRHWVVGAQHVRLNLDNSYTLSWSAAHEFGHLLNLSDHYSESFWSQVSSLFGGERSPTTPEAGYDNNIMGVNGGRLESRNAQDLIAHYIAYSCVRWRLESPL